MTFAKLQLEFMGGRLVKFYHKIALHSPRTIITKGGDE